MMSMAVIVVLTMMCSVAHQITLSVKQALLVTQRTLLTMNLALLITDYTLLLTTEEGVTVTVAVPAVMAVTAMEEWARSM